MCSEVLYLKYNCFLILGCCIIYNLFISCNKLWDLYGIVKFDLLGLLLGYKYLYLRLFIYCCFLLDICLGLEKLEGFILGQLGNVDVLGMVLVIDI